MIKKCQSFGAISRLNAFTELFDFDEIVAICTSIRVKPYW